MLGHRCRRGCLLVMFAVACAAPASAQAPRPVEIFGGYTFAHDVKNDVSLPAGWLAGGAIGVNRFASAVVDISGGYKTLDAFGSDIRLSALAAMAGVRASARLGRLTEFAQLLAGIVRGSGTAFGFANTTNAFAFQPGVGIDYPLTARVAARGQLDVRFIHDQPDGNQSGYEYRFAAALVYHFTRR